MLHQIKVQKIICDQDNTVFIHLFIQKESSFFI